MRVKLLSAVVAIVTLVLAAQAFWLEPDSLHVQTYDLPLQHWPAAQSGLRIAVLADIHAGAPWIRRAKLQQICAEVQAAAPDLILHTGDFLAGPMPFRSEMTPDGVAKALACLHAPLGVYAILGNSDYEYGAGTMIRKAFESNGVQVIENQLLKIAYGGQHFWLFGITDISQGTQPIKKLLEKVSDDAPIIAFTHQPSIFHALPARINLLIAGHTHGGQVRLPLLGRPALDYLKMAKFPAGHISSQTDLFVSTGIGTNNLGVRFGVPPEISLLVLRPAP